MFVLVARTNLHWGKILLTCVLTGWFNLSKFLLHVRIGFACEEPACLFSCLNAYNTELRSGEKST